MMTMNATTAEPERKNPALRKKFEHERALNAQIRAALEQVQKQYMTKAQDRLGAQKKMYEIMDFIQKSDWRMAKNQDESKEKVAAQTFQLSQDCEKRARAILDQLDKSTKTHEEAKEESMKEINAVESSRLDDNLLKCKHQNEQLTLDIKNRQFLLVGETQIYDDFEATTQKVVDILEEAEVDEELFEQVLLRAST